MSPSPDLLETPGRQPTPTLELGQRAVGPTLDLRHHEGGTKSSNGIGALVAICVVMGIVALAVLLPKSLEGSIVDSDGTTPGLVESLGGSLSSAFGSGATEEPTVPADGAPVAGEADAEAPTADPSAALSNLYVDITNSTGFPITQIYVSPSSSDDWGTNLLAGRTLAVGETERVDLSRYSEATFDIRLVDSDGDSYTYSGFDVTTGDIVASIDHIDT